MGPAREPVTDMMERLSMPIPECGCFAWLGKIGTGGYAYVCYREGNRRFTRKAATVALELAGRSRPDGLEVDHICRTRWCVNPDHMRYATRSENSLNRAPYTVPSRQKGAEHRKAYQKKWREEHAEHLKAYYREYDKNRR